MKTFLENVRQLIARIMGQSSQPDQQKVALVKGLLGALEATQEKELSCDEVFEVIDKYAEALIRGENPETIMPLVHHHIAMCGECREELEMLLEMLRMKTA